jgi:hypothetical protein
MTLRELQAKIKAIDVQTLKEEAIWQNQDEIIRLNQSQLHLGMTSKGSAITPLYRARSYAEFKASLSSYDAPNYTPDLYLTGDFYKSMGIEIGNGEYDIFSNDSKADDLTLKYKDIFGLTDENLEIARQLCTKTFINLLSEKLKN